MENFPIISGCSFNSTDSTWCSRTIRVRSTIPIAAIRCRCCPATSARTSRKVEKVSFLSAPGDFVPKTWNKVWRFFRLPRSHNAAISPGPTDAAERRVPDAVQTDQQQEDPNHSRWRARVCRWRRKDLHTALGNWNGFIVSAHRSPRFDVLCVHFRWCATWSWRKVTSCKSRVSHCQWQRSPNSSRKAPTSSKLPTKKLFSRMHCEILHVSLPAI